MATVLNLPMVEARMTILREICHFLDLFAPPHLAEEWDNVGLLVGDPEQAISRVMTCLTVTPASAAEAVRQRADLIVTHHPLPFKPLKRLTSANTPGRLLLSLIRAGIAVHSPHTAFDSAMSGINQQLSEGLGLIDVRPLVPAADGQPLGSGRFGTFLQPQSLSNLAARIKAFLKIDQVQVVGRAEQSVASAAVACGSAGSFLEPAIQSGCQLLVTGETSFHTCLEAEANNVALLLVGHYASERFAVEGLAEVLAGQFGGLTVWSSRDERDPLAWL
jgi:dinuclear metal center YbgI/SA1388 family protein